MLIAVPTDDPGGLDASISEHFGHCAAFTLISVENGGIGDVSVVPNSGHEQGGCMSPVHTLKELGAEVLLAGGMGMRPLSGFQQEGIAVHFKEDATSVREAVELFLAGDCRSFGEAQTCGGGGGGCGGHHHHEDVVREPIVGSADIREGRVVTLEYELKDADGNLIESSERGGPMRYLQGAGQFLPVLESAVAGLDRGAQVAVAVGPEDGFGERDEEKIIEVARDQVPPDCQVGIILSARDESGQPLTLRVIDLDDENVRLDANHPLAGMDVVFHLTVVDVEQATAEEITHGHVH
jgi:FKBP-type peptidyl-prolyl cis-trans isomerase 2/predicted Fe-Mo cluster-binding NifX family protein